MNKITHTKKASLPLSLLVLLFISIILITNYYTNSTSITTINNDSLISMYVDSSFTQSIDTTSNTYTIDSDSSYCTINGEVDTTITISWTNNQAVITPFESSNMKCFIYLTTE